MQRLIPIVLVLAVAAGCSSPAAVDPGSSTSTSAPVARTTTVPAGTTTTSTPEPIDVAAWRTDLEALVSDLEHLHPDPYWRVGEEAFKGDVAAVSARLPDLTADQAILEIVRLSALIDGHTQTPMAFLGWDLAHIQFYGFDDGIGVVAAEDPTLVGGRLIAIDGVPAAVVWDRVAILASYDNPMTKKLTSPFIMTVPRVLAALGISPEPTAVTYTIATVDGTTVEVTPDTGSFADYRVWFGDPVIGLPSSERMTYLDKRTTPFWWTTLDDGTIYFQYNEVSASGRDPATGEQIRLQSLVDDISDRLDGAPGTRLVVDVRHNGGGDNHTYPGVLAMLARHYRDSCGLFVLTGRATFSAAVNFVTEVEQQTAAVFVGEPTGGSPNLYGDATGVTLPESGIQVLISTRYWGFGGPDDHRVWVAPDIAVPPTLADWNTGRDAALEAALAAPICGA